MRGKAIPLLCALTLSLVAQVHAGPRSIVELQPGRVMSSVGLPDSAGRLGLVNLNPTIYSSYILTLENRRSLREFHTENPAPRT